jgi:hypothetical protein
MMTQWTNYARKLRPQDAGHTRCQAGRIPKALASTIREIRTAGLVSNKAITHELNQRQYPLLTAANSTEPALISCCTVWKD